MYTIAIDSNDFIYQYEKKTLHSVHTVCFLVSNAIQYNYHCNRNIQNELLALNDPIYLVWRCQFKMLCFQKSPIHYSLHVASADCTKCMIIENVIRENPKCGWCGRRSGKTFTYLVTRLRQFSNINMEKLVFG